MIDPKATTVRRLVVARVLLVGVAIIAAAVAGTRPAGIIQMVAWAFLLAAAGLFAPLVLVSGGNARLRRARSLA